MSEKSRAKQRAREAASGNKQYNPYPMCSDYAPCPCGSGQQYRHCCRMSPHEKQVLDEVGKVIPGMIRITLEAGGKRVVMATDRSIMDEPTIPEQAKQIRENWDSIPHVMSHVIGSDPMGENKGAFTMALMGLCIRARETNPEAAKTAKNLEIQINRVTNQYLTSLAFS